MAVSAIANGGRLLRPYVIGEIRDVDGNVVEKRGPEMVRQVISEDTAKRATAIMEEVVNTGSGANAVIEGYRIAGKTGTAQKVGPGGVYMPDEFILSFIGFAPAEDPQILLYIAVDGAKRGPQWGSQVSAPLFKAIMKDVLSYLEIPPARPAGEEEVKLIEVPELKGKTVDEAGALLDNRGLLLKLVGKEGIIKDQTPKAGAQVPLHTGIIVYLDDLWDENNPEHVFTPDLKGMTVKEVGEVLSRLHLKMESVGSGVVVKQEPEAGTNLREGSSVKVHFSSPLH
jgi:stage V sporulation protein D (sporulation-specific penicillin-binding protein)